MGIANRLLLLGAASLWVVSLAACNSTDQTDDALAPLSSTDSIAGTASMSETIASGEPQAVALRVTVPTVAQSPSDVEQTAEESTSTSSSTSTTASATTSSSTTTTAASSSTSSTASTTATTPSSTTTTDGSTSTTSAPPSSDELSRAEAASLTLLNELRTSLGLQSVQMSDSQMSEFAREWSLDMRQNGFRHSSARWSENIVYYSAANMTPQEAAARFHDMWVNSPGHYRNMTNPDWTVVGIGFYHDESGWWGTHVFR